MLRTDGQSDSPSAAACPPLAPASATCRGEPQIGCSLTPKFRNPCDTPPSTEEGNRGRHSVCANLIPQGGSAWCPRWQAELPVSVDAAGIGGRWWQMEGER